MKERVTGWRRIAGAMWNAPNDPQIFGALDIDAEAILAFMRQARARGHRVTPTHLVGRAVAHALAAVPEVNVRIRGGRLEPRPSIDIFFITAVEHGHDLSGVKLRAVDQQAAIHIATDLAERSASLKHGEDREFARTKRLVDHLPSSVLRTMLRASALITQRFGLEIPMLNLRPDPFGSAMITSVGMLGLPQGFAPLAWMYDVPLLVLVGEITSRPAVVDGKVVARDVLPITATIDHRYADGWHISQLMTAFRAYLEHPEQFEPALLPAQESRRESASSQASRH